MRYSLLLAATALTITTAACDKKEPANDATLNDMAANMNAEADMNAIAAAPLADADFANAVASGGHHEIVSAELAAKQAASADLKALAGMIGADHAKAGAELKAAAAAATPAVTPADTLTAKQKADIDALKAAKGADFDKLYVSQQIAAHEEALAALTAYAAGGSSDSLKAFAAKTVPVVQGHLDRLHAMKM